jgi:hypothetical protein
MAHVSTAFQRDVLAFVSVGSNESLSLQKQSPVSSRLKKAITNLIQNIPYAELVCVFSNMIKRANACSQARGDHFQ